MPIFSHAYNNNLKFRSAPHSSKENNIQVKSLTQCN